MTVAAVYTIEEVKKLLVGVEVLSQKLTKGRKIYVRKVGRCSKMEIKFLIVQVGSEVIPQDLPENVEKETYEALTRAEDGTLVWISEDCQRGKTHNLICLPDPNNKQAVCAIVKVIRYFS